MDEAADKADDYKMEVDEASYQASSLRWRCKTPNKLLPRSFFRG